MKISFTLFLILVLGACSSRKKKNIVKPSQKKIIGEALASGPQLKTTHFSDVTDQIGLGGLEAYQIAVVDLNDDGYDDLSILPKIYSSPLFFIYQPHLRKFLPTMENPFSKRLMSSFMLYLDLDKDGVTDLISVVFNQKKELGFYPIRVFQGVQKNKTLKFIEINGAVKLPPMPTSSLGVIDFNQDGLLDLYVGNWFIPPASEGYSYRDYLLRGEKLAFSTYDKHLIAQGDYNSNAGMYTNAKPTWSVSSCDFDQDSYPDILTTSTHGHSNQHWMNIVDPSKRDKRERIYQNFGEKTGFAHDSLGSLKITGGGRTYFASCNDYNNDGVFDIFVGEVSYAFDGEDWDRSSILTGNSFSFPPSFLRTEYIDEHADNQWNQGDRRGIWVDFNADGYDDLLVDNSGFPPKSRLVIFQQRDDHSFEDKGFDWGVDVVNPHNSIVMDFNNDGKMDIITAQINSRNSQIKQRLWAFENTLDIGSNRGVKFFLVGESSNIKGYNSLLEFFIKKDNQLYSRKKYYETIRGGIPSQNADGIYIGLKEGEEIVEVKVTWPISNNRIVKYKIKDSLKHNTKVILYQKGGIEIK